MWRENFDFQIMYYYMFNQLKSTISVKIFLQVRDKNIFSQIFAEIIRRFTKIIHIIILFLRKGVWKSTPKILSCTEIFFEVNNFALKLKLKFYKFELSFLKICYTKNNLKCAERVLYKIKSLIIKKSQWLQYFL